MSHEEATIDDFDALNKRVDTIERQFKEAFPNGDHLGHCRYHEIQIQDLLAKRQLIQDIKGKTISGLVWAVIVSLGIAVWQYIKSQVRS